MAARQQHHPRASWHLVRRAGFKPSWSRWEPTSLLKHYLYWQFQQRGPRTNEDHYWVRSAALCREHLSGGHRCIYHEERGSQPSFVISPLRRSMAKSLLRSLSPCVGQASLLLQAPGSRAPPGQTGQLVQQDSAQPPCPPPAEPALLLLGHVLPEEALDRAGTLSWR